MGDYFPVLMIGLITLFCFYLFATRSKRKEYYHTSGLPLDYKEKCAILLTQDGLSIVSKQKTIDLPFSKIKSIVIQNNPLARTELKELSFNLSSTFLFGAAGASMMKSNAPQNTLRGGNVNEPSSFLLITYRNGAEFTQARFGIKNEMNYCRTLVKKYNKRVKAHQREWQ